MHPHNLTSPSRGYIVGIRVKIVKIIALAMTAISRSSRAAICLSLLLAPVVALSADWPEWRGPSRDGVSHETNLPSRWSPAGENLAWRLPFGGRSAPVVFGNRLYLLTNTTEGPATTQERLVAVDVNSGKVVWERRFSIYLSDVPQHRVAWSSPAVDPETGNIYAFTVGAQLFCVSPEGKIVWERSMPEEHGAVTTHGGRTTSPIIEGDKVILNALILAWGDLGRPGNRYFAFDKRTGQTIWISSPQTRHYDTNYSTPIVADVNGTKELIVGGTDGVFHAIKLNTGEPVWRVEVSKRAILNSPLYRDGVAYITHGEENIDTTEMGMVAAVDATRTGALDKQAFKWNTRGFLPTFASPVMDAERLYSVDNGAIVAAFDLKDGKQLWQRTLGTLQKGSPVLADGKLYVGTENGKFYILQPSATGVEVLDEDQLGTPQEAEPIIASPVVADGRVYVTSMEHVYAIGTRRAPTSRSSDGSNGVKRSTANQGAGEVAHVQIFPYEALLAPGAQQKFQLRLYDGQGNFIREELAAGATWAVENLTGTVAADGTFKAPGVASLATRGEAGLIKATIGGLTGQARVRVVAPLPYTFDFEQPAGEAPISWWVGAPTKVFQRTVEGIGPVLVRPRDETVGRRAKVFIGWPTASGYTVEADVRGREQRRQRGDIGLINQRYGLVLFGNGQKLELHPWQAADEMTVRVPFAWKADTWYRMKLRVDNRSDGTTQVRGKVWPTGEAEPAAWTIEKVDKIPHRAGSPGLYADGIADMYFDNVSVYPNK
jgi:outer membrane protein assembly factor BamB